MIFCPNAVDWTAVGTCVGAAFTAVAAVGTVGTLVYAINSTNQARKETRALQQQVADDKQREQARHVCAWIQHVPQRVVIRFSNSSTEPVTNAVAYIVWVQGAAYHTGLDAEAWASGRPAEIGGIRAVMQAIPPGQFFLELRGPSNMVMQGEPGIELAFTDAAGHHWTRTAEGRLAAHDRGAFDHYGISRPIDYATLVPVQPGAPLRYTEHS